MGWVTIVLVTTVWVFLAAGVGGAADPHKTAAGTHLRRAVSLGQRALGGLSSAASLPQLDGVLPLVRDMLEHAKQASGELKNARQLNSPGPLLTMQIDKIESTHGLIRYTLDQTGRPWEEYQGEAMRSMRQAVVTLQTALAMM